MVDHVKLSKTLSFWLRHQPEAGGLKLDVQGWAEVGAVVQSLRGAGLTINRDDVEAMVAANSKQRFEFSPDGKQIRARQGHSVKVELDWPEREPPEFLYHGTVARFLNQIMAEGIQPMKRHHVHLSPNIATAQQVGARRGQPVILRIGAAEMAAAGMVFQLTDNDVWLTDQVPPEYVHLLG